VSDHDHGTQLGLDLNELYTTAKLMSSVSDIYRGALRSLDTPDWSPGLADHPVVEPWTSLQVGVGDVLAKTAINLDDTAHALMAAANDYAATDAEAAAEFDRLRRDGGD
jgi:hypothetical protein